MLRESERGAAIDAVFAYHDRTKHHFQRYARSLGYLDWANQPDPFRRYDGARQFLLPFRDDDPTPKFDDLFTSHVPAATLDSETLGLFLEQSLGISASKSHAGSNWKLRCNPSSGNLHPTEGYIIAGGVRGIGVAAGVYHYMPEEHALELRSEIAEETRRIIAQAFPPDTFFCGLASVHWREAWKYGERAFRYCHHDVGHALGAIRYSAASLGWRCVLLDALADESVEHALGLGASGPIESEREYGDVLMAIVTGGGKFDTPNSLPADGVASVRTSLWSGSPNRLSAEHVDWSIIPTTAEMCRKPNTEVARRTLPPISESNDSRWSTCSSLAGRLFRQRRSAVALDGKTSVSRDAFYRMLHATLPVRPSSLFDFWPYGPCIDLAVFVHRVDGLASGLYALMREPARTEALQAAMRPEFRWERPAECPDDLPLYLLGEADCQRLAAQVSCLQEIAGDGSFSLGMIADFERTIREHGAWMYPRLFWEAGLVGQVLYLEAEAAGVRATGIGCYFDDAMHEVLGLRGRAFQSMYHFTVGGAIEDPRITGLPPYTDERRRQGGWV